MYFTLFLIFFSAWCVDGAVVRRAEPSPSFQLSLVHFNDFHARFEQTSPSSTKCNELDSSTCIGGFPRLFTAINQLKEKRPDSVIVNAGDSFQGTLWYNLLKWNVTEYFMNMLPLDAHTLGNHEFDDGIAGVVPYLKSLKAPVLVSNIDDTSEPKMKNLYQDSTTIERNGTKIGIIGVILKSTNLIANTEKLKFTDEIAAVKRVSDKLSAEGVNVIIVLSHCGVNVDRLIAAGVGNNVDIIVGGHSHTLLYPIALQPPNGEKAVDDYPIQVKQASGNTVLVVQASAFTKYLGNILVNFDSNGRIQSWEGVPIYLDHSIKEDEGVLNLMKPYQDEVNALGKRVVGYTKVLLDKGPCSILECNIGNFITDAFVDYLVGSAEPEYWTYAAVSIINQGGIRTNIDVGTITYEDLIISQPFNNYIQTFDLKGKYIVEALEYAVKGSINTDYSMSMVNMLQVSGLQIVYNVTKPAGQRVISAKIRCAKCKIPSYSPIEQETLYRLATPSFVGDGGDGFQMISDNRKNLMVWGVDVDILEMYVKKQSPIVSKLEKRLIVLT